MLSLQRKGQTQDMLDFTNQVGPTIKLKAPSVDFKKMRLVKRLSKRPTMTLEASKISRKLAND